MYLKYVLQKKKLSYDPGQFLALPIYVSPALFVFRTFQDQSKNTKAAHPNYPEYNPLPVRLLSDNKRINGRLFILLTITSPF